MEWRISLWTDSTTFNMASCIGLHGTGLYFLVHCSIGWRWRVEFPFPLLTLLQPKSYPVPSISVRIFTIPKLQNIHSWHFSGELSSLFIKDLSNFYYFVRPLQFSCHVEKNWSFMDHLSHALPTEKIFELLRYSIRSESIIRHCPAELVFDMLKVIIKWLEVSFKECNRHLETPQTDMRFALGTWLRATERLVRSLPSWTSSSRTTWTVTWTDKLFIITKFFTY